MKLQTLRKIILSTLFVPWLAAAQWTRVDAIPSVDVASLYITGNTILAGTDSAVYISTDSGMGWIRSATLPGSPMFIDAVTMFDGKIVAGTGGNGMYVSSNSGQSWTALSQGLVGLGSNYIRALVERGGSLYAGTGGAGVFQLQGNAWVLLGDLSGQLAGDVAYLGTKGDTLVAGAGGNGYVWYAPPSASTWTGVLVAPIQVEPFVVTSFARYGSAHYVGGTYRAYRSANNGVGWEFAGSGLPGGRSVMLFSVGQVLYAAASAAATGFYRYNNDGTWTLLENTNFTYAVATLGSRVYAARLDGLWYRTFDPTHVGDPELLPGSIVLEQNYPNPFNPSTSIVYRVESRKSVELSVFDILGRKVATLVNEELQPGTYTRTFNADGLSSGVYYYRLSINGAVATRRMVLLQ